MKRCVWGATRGAGKRTRAGTQGLGRSAAGHVGAWLVITLLSACSGMRAAEHPAAPTPPAPAEIPTPPPPAAESSPPEPTTDNAQPSGSETVVPACLPAETKPKQKAKPKPKPVRKEAPQQPEPPPTTAGNPGGVVDAEVRAMPVSVTSILGKKVWSPKGDDLGRVVDVLADASGRVRIAIIDFGGFLGVGDHRIAVDWPLLHFNPDREPSLLLSLSREKLKSAPEYKDNPHPQILVIPPAAEGKK